MESENYDGYKIVTQKHKKPRLFNVRQLHITRMHDFLKECANIPGSTINDACKKFVNEFDIKSQDKDETQIHKHVIKRVVEKYKLIVHRKTHSSLSEKQLKTAQELLSKDPSTSLYDIGKQIDFIQLSWNDLFIGYQQLRKRGRQKSPLHSLCSVFMENSEFKNSIETMYNNNCNLNEITKFIVDFSNNNEEFSSYSDDINNNLTSYLLYSFNKYKKRSKRLSSETREKVKNRIKELYADKTVRLKNISSIINSEFGTDFKSASITTMISMYKLNSEHKRTNRSEFGDSIDSLSDEQKEVLCNMFLKGKSINEIYQFVNSDFSKNIKKNELQTYIKSMGLGKQKISLSSEEQDWLKSNYSVYIDSDCFTNQFNETFNKELSISQVMDLVKK